MPRARRARPRPGARRSGSLARRPAHTRELVRGGARATAVSAVRDPGAIPVEVASVIELPDDFRDLLVELARAQAEFVVVGGHAVAFHGHPRATKDLDVLVRATSDNAER